MGHSLTALLDETGIDLSKLREMAEVLLAEELKPLDLTDISSWSNLTRYLGLKLARRGREQFRVLFLNRKNRLLADELMGEGTVDHAPVYPREVMRRALELDASALILVHNHPAGDPSPSVADIEMTKQLVEASRALKITVHDHVIVGAGQFTSFRQQGLIS